MQKSPWSLALLAATVVLAFFALTGCQDNGAAYPAAMVKAYAGTYIGTLDDGSPIRIRARPENFIITIDNNGQVTTTFFIEEDESITMTGTVSAKGALHAERPVRNLTRRPTTPVSLEGTSNGNKIFRGTWTLSDDRSYQWEAIPYTGDFPWAGKSSNTLDGDYPGDYTATVGENGIITVNGAVTGYGNFRATGKMTKDGMIGICAGTVSIPGQGDQPIYFTGMARVIGGKIVIRGRVDFSFA